MKIVYLKVALFSEFRVNMSLFFHEIADSTKQSDKGLNNSIEVEDQLAKRIYAIIEHFKQTDPVGLPLLPITDPTVSYNS